MSNLLDSCRGHHIQCLNSSYHTSSIKFGDMLGTELELLKFLVVILEMCENLLVETVGPLEKDDGDVA